MDEYRLPKQIHPTLYQEKAKCESGSRNCGRKTKSSSMNRWQAGGEYPPNHTSRIIQSCFSSSPIIVVVLPHSTPTSGLNLPSMMSGSRRLTGLVRQRLIVRTYTSSVPRLSENRMQPNDPNPPAPKPNVSETNAVPVEALSKMDNSFREDPAVGERIRSLQAPNRPTTWAASQQPREKAMTGPRFEQTIMETQVCR